ncbi:hypothetical protein [Streptomyces kronopolitis]|uniref:hypothetical protein n=1 Tax=Streptomyces kronopolitis TaxID=1612435 RepID=UPI0034372090
MPDRIVLASASAFAAGIAVTVVATDDLNQGSNDSLLGSLAVRVLPLVACAAVIAAIVRRWLYGIVRQAHAEMAAAAADRASCEKRMTKREHDVEQAEEKLRHTKANVAKLVALVTERLEGAQSTLEAERSARAELQGEYDELANDYNQLVTDSLQQRANFFKRGAAGQAAEHAPAQCIPIQGRKRHGDGYEEADAAPHRVCDVSDPMTN